MATSKNYWLMKSEPETYSIDQLKADKKAHWDGVRNYQARNFMRDQMRVGDLVLFYHSNAEPPGVAGVAKVIRASHPDHTALDPKSDYFEPRATKEDPVWYTVDLGFVKKFPTFVTLEALKSSPKLNGLMVIRKGIRLSVQPVNKAHFDVIEALGLKRNGS